MNRARVLAFAGAWIASVTLASAALAGAGLGCGGSHGAQTSQFPPREEGCAVELLQDAPARPTVNIGRVSASCDETVAEADCLRTLKDQACKLGGDIVWEVPTEPIRKNGRQLWSGRAVHTK
ncbi:hypothetical protein [Pendulispora albinea]|uniref:Uncharacterized protein n=1 Tax=Pendulispora albinea TaxID=2741071 RepID=A0ABZ2LW84_9BACT